MDNNKLTRFDVKNQTHGLSALGGIPQGKAPNGAANLVESGETKQNNFVYSNRISLDGDLVKAFNLPSYVKNKTISDASKSIDDKFKDRQDKYAQETRSTLMSRLGQAQEALKQQEQIQQERINQSLQANSQEIPDQSNGQIPPGMEGFVDQGQPIPEQGGPGLPQGDQMVAAMGGYLPKYFDNGGYLQGDNNLDGIVDVKATVDKFGNPVTKTAPSTAGIAGASVGAAGSLMGLGNLAFGKSAQDTSGQAASGHVNAAGMIGGSALTGATSGAQLGNAILPGIGGAIGAGTGAIVGGIAGGLGFGKARKAEAENTRNFAANTNRSLSDNYAAYGGTLGFPGSLDYGQPKPLDPQPQDDWYSKNPPSPQLQAGAAPYAKPSNWYDTNPPLFADATAGPYKEPTLGQQAGTIATQTGKGLKQAGKVLGNTISENAGEAMRFAPIAMNAYQLANLGKTQGVNYATSGARFKPGYVDEAQMQRIVDQEANNQIQGLQESGASQGAVRAATLAAGLNKTKALGDAYSQAAAANRATDVQGQQFNYAVDASNIATRNKALDEMRMDDAARRGAKSKLLGSIGTDIGNVGKEISDAQLAGALTGYSRKGKYLVNNKTGERLTPEQQAQVLANAKSMLPGAVATPKKGDKYTDPTTGQILTYKMGGYLTSKPSKY